MKDMNEFSLIDYEARTTRKFSDRNFKDGNSQNHQQKRGRIGVISLHPVFKEVLKHEACKNDCNQKSWLVLNVLDTSFTPQLTDEHWKNFLLRMHLYSFDKDYLENVKKMKSLVRLDSELIRDFMKCNELDFEKQIKLLNQTLRYLATFGAWNTWETNLFDIFSECKRMKLKKYESMMAHIRNNGMALKEIYEPDHQNHTVALTEDGKDNLFDQILIDIKGLIQRAKPM